MSGNERKGPCFPCHIYDIADAKEAYDAFRGEFVRNYGDNVTLKNGEVLHWNYMWDDGSRILVRCRECGGLMIRQFSEFHSFTDAPDGYYQDWIPVASEEEADLMNILFAAMDMEHVPCRHIRLNNGSVFWTKGPEPVRHDPEELKKRILQEYAKVSPARLKKLFPAPAKG